MATTTTSTPPQFPFDVEHQPLQLTLPLPNSVQTTIHLHLTILKYGLQLFLTTRNGPVPSIPPPSSSLLDTSVAIDPAEALGGNEGSGVGITTTGRGSAPLGSFVVGFPGGPHSKETLSTSLYICESTIDTTVRLAKVLAKRFQLPVYVGNSMSFAGAGLGGSPEEEIAAFGEIVKAVVAVVEKARKGGGGGGGEEV